MYLGILQDHLFREKKTCKYTRKFSSNDKASATKIVGLFKEITKKLYYVGERSFQISSSTWVSEWNQMCFHMS